MFRVIESEWACRNPVSLQETVTGPSTDSGVDSLCELTVTSLSDHTETATLHTCLQMCELVLGKQQ